MRWICLLLVCAACPSGSGTRRDTTQERDGDGAGSTENGATPPRPLIDAAPKIPTGVAAPYEVATGTGTIAGVVTIAAAPVAPTGCPAETLQVSKDLGVAGAVVWLDDLAAGKLPPEADVPEEGVADCALVPPITRASRLGASFAVRNDDTDRHEVAIVKVATLPGLEKADAALARFPLPLEGQRFTVALDEPGVYRATCVLHGEVGHVVAPPHPYVTLTDEAGAFSLTEVPPGTYRVRAFHPTGWLVAEAQVVVTDGAVTAPALVLASP